MSILEQHVGLRLFNRFHRRIELMAEGLLVARATAESFSTLSSGLA
ncbi:MULTISPECIES: hypothetical protein [unclassified Mesorhizobium]